MRPDRHLIGECGCFFVEMGSGPVTVSLCRRHREQVRLEFDVDNPDPVAALRGALSGEVQ